MSVLPPQSTTPHLFANLPSKATLVYEFKGKPLNALRTPAMVIDRAIFAKNCARMHEAAHAWKAAFRAHVKTHKAHRLFPTLVFVSGVLTQYDRR